jgi:DNA repair exonuclease SbcCD nuclease subunit
MRISILSDFHFGFAQNSELENDSFDNAEEAMQKALDSDLILIAGDIFDSRLPKTSTWAKAIKILVKPLIQESTGVKLVSCTKELKEISKRTLNHLPVVALHGTHERRSKSEANVIEALEHAGILIHLHCQTIVFEKDGVKVAVHGMSGVPERYAKDVMYEWGPLPLPDCFNIMMLHQSIDPFVYSPLEPPSITTSNLPKGFDLIVDGHIHSSGQEKIGNTQLIFPGSTVVTQLEKNEAGARKGFYQVEIDEYIKINFIPLENNRKFFYEEIKVEGSLREQIKNIILKILDKGFSKPPIIKFKIVGKETDVLDQDLRDLQNKYSDIASIIFTKELEIPEMIQKIEFLRNLREQKLSVEEIGVEILKKNLDGLNFEPIFDHEQMFDLLSENNSEKAFKILIGEQKILGGLI